MQKRLTLLFLLKAIRQNNSLPAALRKEERGAGRRRNAPLTAVRAAWAVLFM